MSKLNRYNDFYLKQMVEKQANKKKVLDERKIREFHSIIEEGKKNDIISIYLKNNSKINESYTLILEDKEILQDTKKVVCAKFYKDRIAHIATETRKYLESRNIPDADIRLIESNMESILMVEGGLDNFTNWLLNTSAVKGLKKGAEFVGGVLVDMVDYLSDAAKEVWNSIVEDIFKPGLEALKNVATKLFGADIVAAIEITAKKVINSLDEFMKTSKSIFDKVYGTLKEMAKNLVNIVKDIWVKIKEILGKVWEFIKNHALKVVPGVKAKIAKVKDLGNKINSQSLSNELKILGEDVKDMKNFFVGKIKDSLGISGTEVATSSANKIMATDEAEAPVNDSFIWDSLKGFMVKKPDFNTEELLKMHETKVDRIFEAEEKSKEGKHSEEEEEVEHETHKAESRGIKKWLTGLAMWVLSPFGKLMEIAGEVIAKGLAAVPAWLSGKLGTLLDGVKGIVNHAKKFVALGTLVAFIVGSAAEAFALGTHLPGNWIADAGEKIGLTSGHHTIEAGAAGQIPTLAGMEKNIQDAVKKANESRLHKFEEFNKINESGGGSKGIDWKGLAIGAGSALISFLVSVFTHSIPGLHMTFEIISLTILIIATLGWCFTETEWGKKLAKQDSALISLSKSFLNFIHGGH
jgi:hypothetical protein